MFTTIESKNKYIQVMEQISDLILSQNLKIGDKLPTEVELTQMFNISRNSVREALSAFEAIGVIEKRHPLGVFISTDPVEGLNLPISLAYKLVGGTTEDTLRCRYVMDLQILRLTVSRENIDFSELDQNLIEMQRCETPEEMLEVDLKFHYIISKLCGNKLLSILSFVLNQLDREQSLVSYHKLLESIPDNSFKEVKRIACENHNSILQAMKSRDYTKAAKYLCDGYEIAFPELDFSLERTCI